MSNKSCNATRFSLIVMFVMMVKRMLFACQYCLDSVFSKNEIFIVGKNITDERRKDILHRLHFYLPELTDTNLNISQSWPLRAMVTREPVLVADKLSLFSTLAKAASPNCFNIDCYENATDGWEWVKLVNFYYKHYPDINRSKKIFDRLVCSLKQLRLSKSYIFGTGPSLESAIEKDWSDGYRIVCNTIVRDADLWRHLNPHFIVAGDAIYHFGHTSFARAFRSDLAKRLGETETYFLYPQVFDKLVRRELGGFSERLIPVPQGEHKNIHSNLIENFSLPSMGNVLPLLLLPLGCTLSRNIMLWGFDGRAPNDNDKPFWSNSSKHTYSESFQELIAAHPRFFDYFVPKTDQHHYVNLVHGDLLDERLTIAEHEGFTFVMMHHTWTPTLQKRQLP